MGLKTSLPARPKVEPVRTAEGMEARILRGEESGAGAASVYVRKDAGTYNLEPRSRKEPAILMNAKLPLRLHARLKRTAQFNDISMTEILIRALEAELETGRYAAPPEKWGSEQ
jgi:hypothetical protein